MDAGSDVCRDRVRKEWQGRTEQDKTGDSQTNTHTQTINMYGLDRTSSVQFCSQT